MKVKFEICCTPSTRVSQRNFITKHDEKCISHVLNINAPLFRVVLQSRKSYANVYPAQPTEKLGFVRVDRKTGQQLIIIYPGKIPSQKHLHLPFSRQMIACKYVVYLFYVLFSSSTEVATGNAL